MLTSFPTALILGAALGFLSGLGVGGGSLLILWLTIVTGMEPEKARLLNLLFFIPSAIIATFFRWKHADLQWKKLLPSILGGCISAAAFSMLSKHMDTGLLQKIFGVLFVITGIRELLYRPPKERGCLTKQAR